MRVREVLVVVAVAALGACGGGGGPAVDAAPGGDGPHADAPAGAPDAPAPADAATVGAVAVTIHCTGAACGLTGVVRIVVDDCAGGTSGSFKSLGTKTLSGAADLMSTVDAVAPGARCVTVYLDVNNDFNQDKGDAIASAGATHVTVVAGQTATAAVTLDAIAP